MPPAWSSPPATTPDTAAGCFITAHDADTGQEQWRTYTIARPGEPGDATMTYMVEGRQDLAIPVGTNMLAQFSIPLTPENVVPADRTPGNGSVLMVFALPD